MPEITPKDMTSPQKIAQVPAPKPVAAETPAVTPQVDPKVEEAKRMELFAKRERMVRYQAKQAQEAQRQVEQERAALKAREAELNSVQEWKQRATDPKGLLDWANESGLTTEQLTQAMLDPGRMTDNQIYQLRKEIQSLKTAHEQQQEQSKQAQTESYKQALEVIRSDAKDFIETEAANYPTFMEFLTLEGESKPDEFVRDYIEEHHQAYNKVLTVDQAVAQIEKQIIDQGVKYSKFKKVQEIINANANQTLEQRKAPTPAPRTETPPMRTLTHDQISQSNQVRRYTTKERIERAKMIAQGKNPDVA